MSTMSNRMQVFKLMSFVSVCRVAFRIIFVGCAVGSCKLPTGLKEHMDSNKGLIQQPDPINPFKTSGSVWHIYFRSCKIAFGLEPLGSSRTQESPNSFRYSAHQALVKFEELCRVPTRIMKNSLICSVSIFFVE